MKFLMAILLSLMLLPMAGAAQGLSETRKIEMLIDSVEHMPGAVFIRNGSEHSSKEAAAHMRMKWKYAGKRIKTAGDFIRYCATASSITRVKYRILLADGSLVESGKLLHERLRQIESRPGAATTARVK